MIIGLIVSVYELFCQQQNETIVEPLLMKKKPRCEELFPLSHYEGNMILSEKHIKGLSDNTLDTYAIFIYEKDLITEPYTEIYPEYIESRNSKYNNIYFKGTLADTKIALESKLVVKAVPQGIWKTYYIDPATGKERLIKSMNLENEMVYGDYTVWDMEGNILYRMTADTLGFWTMKDYFPSGKTRVEGEYLNGKRNGSWKWYDEKGRKTVEELYLDGKYLKRLIPYDITFNILTDDPENNNGFVILENEDDGRVSTEPIYWSNKQPVLQLRDTVGINLYFCIFGYAPSLVKLSGTNIFLNKNTITIKPNRSKVYLGELLWTGKYPINHNAGLNYNYFDLPSQVNAEYNSINHQYCSYSRIYNDIKEIIPFHDFMPSLDKGESIDICLYISKENKITKITGYSKNIPSKRLKDIVLYLQYLQGRQINMHGTIHRGDQVYIITARNTIGNPNSIKRSTQDIEK